MKDLQSTLDGNGSKVRYSYYGCNAPYVSVKSQEGHATRIYSSSASFVPRVYESSNELKSRAHPARPRATGFPETGRGARPRSNRRHAGRRRTIGVTRLTRQSQTFIFVSRVRTGFSVLPFRSVAGAGCVRIRFCGFVLF